MRPCCSSIQISAAVNPLRSNPTVLGMSLASLKVMLATVPGISRSITVCALGPTR
jgi:hypothetical protein